MENSCSNTKYELNNKYCKRRLFSLSKIDINPKIMAQIGQLNEDDDFKELLRNLLQFEKIKKSRGEKEYVAHYDRLISEYVSTHKTDD